MNTEAIQILEKRIKELRSDRDAYLNMRASVGRGYKGYTDRMLAKAKACEATIDNLIETINELKK